MKATGSFQAASTYSGAACGMILIVPLLGAACGTSAAYYVSGTNWPLSEQTANSAPLSISHPGEQRESTSDAILGIRRAASLTWDEVAQIFDVTRRTVHHWASGRPPSADQEKRISRLYGVFRDAGSITPNRVRELLMSTASPGTLYFDLLLKSEWSDLQAALAALNSSMLSSGVRRPVPNGSLPERPLAAITQLEALHDSPPAGSKSVPLKSMRLSRKSA